MPLYIYGPITNVPPYGYSNVTAYSQTNGSVFTDSGYTVISYTNTAGGTLNISGLTGPETIYYLAVGGGGGGGYSWAGGGGGGSVTYGNVIISSTQTISIQVGALGLGRTTGDSGFYGGNSIISGSGFSTITAGGGAGGQTWGSPATNIYFAFGGSGGGGGYSVPSNPTKIVATNPNTYCNVGGGGQGDGGGSGGGGAGSAGAPQTGGNAAPGGDGLQYSSLAGYMAPIQNVLATLPGYGTSLAAGYLGAGGGSGSSEGGNGGSNGAGGPGAALNVFGTPATVYGGGGGGTVNRTSGNGYQGIVILAFRALT